MLDKGKTSNNPKIERLLLELAEKAEEYAKHRKDLMKHW
jgi:histone H3/H4